MTDTLIQLTEDEFDCLYPLVCNHLDPKTAQSLRDPPGGLFDTHGADWAFVREQDPLTVWTLIDGDDRDRYVLSGFHYVNRLGYLVGRTRRPTSVSIEVRIPRAPRRPAMTDSDLIAGCIRRYRDRLTGYSDDDRFVCLTDLLA